MLEVAVLGITGRMGRALATALDAASDCRLAAGLTSVGNAAAGSRACDLIPAISSPAPIVADPEEALRGAQVAVDFTLASATPKLVATCAAAAVPVVVCTTGLDREAEAAIDEASQRIPVLVAANTSVGVAILTRISELAAAGLGIGFDAEIVEAHHAGKRDIPSGTALQLGAAVAEGRGDDEFRPTLRRAGHSGARRPGEIGIASLRAGDIAGEHTVLFAASGERLELTHRVSDRSIFATGAITAARWLSAQPAGRYRMIDALGL